MRIRSFHWSLATIAMALSASLASPALAADNGRFVVLAPRVSSAEWRDEAREMQDSGALQDMAEALNSIFVLPRNIGLRYAECGEANAYYDPEAREITMCLELTQSMAETLDGQFEDDDSTTEALTGAYLAVVLHEAGHALVDVLEIPITGREEDAVDQLSAWMLIEADDAGSVLGAAASYYSDEDESASDDDYADEHSLDKQRYFNLVCWAYGSDPDNSEDLIEDWGLPEARAERCADEYAQLDRSWTRLLGEHLREDDESRVDESAPLTRAPKPGVPRDDGATVGKVKVIERDD